MFAEYLKEKTDDQIIETEKGFVTYCFTNESDCYIKDVYILPQFRNMGAMTEFGDQITLTAKAANKKRLLGSVIPSNKNSTASMKALFAYGMKIDSATNDFILLSKEI